MRTALCICSVYILVRLEGYVNKANRRLVITYIGSCLEYERKYRAPILRIILYCYLQRVTYIHARRKYRYVQLFFFHT